MSRLKLTGTALFVALVVSWPALQHGLIDDTLSLTAMFIRLGVAVALAMVGQAVLGSVIDNFRLQNIIRKRNQEAGLGHGADDEVQQGT